MTDNPADPTLTDEDPTLEDEDEGEKLANPKDHSGDTVTVAERITRNGQLIHSPGEILNAEYASQIGVHDDGTDGGPTDLAPPHDIPPTAGSSWDSQPTAPPGA